jgi:hypothetical protein
MNRRIGVLGAMVLVPGAGFAIDAENFPPFKAVDMDHDGLLSRDEVQAAIPEVLAVFSRADANMDGQLTPAEYETALRMLSPQPGSPS